MNAAMTAKKGFTTTLLHSDRLGKPEHGAMHKPIHTSAAFGYDDVQDLVEHIEAGVSQVRVHSPNQLPRTHAPFSGSAWPKMS